MRLRIVVFFSLLLIPIFVMGQTDFREGYIVTLNYDTVLGRIDYRGKALMGKVCRYKSGRTPLVKYYPKDILGYGFKNGKYYVSGWPDSIPKFLEVLCKGAMTVYFCDNKSKDRFFVKKDSLNLLELDFFRKEINTNAYSSSTQNYVMLDKNKPKKPYQGGEGTAEISSVEHQIQLINYLSDAPELSADILDISIPNHLQLTQLAVKYQQLAKPEGECVVYENYRNRPDIGVIYSMVKFAPEVDDVKYYLCGIQSYFCLPLVSEKVFIGLGFQYSPAKLNPDGYLNVYRIPFSVKYQYPGRILKPNAYAGFNYNSINDTFRDTKRTELSPAIGFGLACRVYKKWHLSYNFGLDFYQYISAEEMSYEKFSQSNSFSLYYDF